MECKYCGGKLRLTDAKCPYCGMENEENRKHAEDMKHFKGQFENTKKNVYQTTRRYTQISVQIVMIAALIVSILMVGVAEHSSYSIRRVLVQWKTENSYEEYSKILDTYLEEEDFIAFQAFCAEKYIGSTDGAYEKYVPLKMAANYYAYCYQNIMQAGFYEGKEYGTSLEWYIENLSGQLSGFYSNLDLERYYYYENYDCEQNKKAIEAMRQNMRYLLITYCGLTMEEAIECETLNEGRRTVLLEEALLYEESNAE